MTGHFMNWEEVRPRALMTGGTSRAITPVNSPHVTRLDFGDGDLCPYTIIAYQYFRKPKTRL